MLNKPAGPRPPRRPHRMHKVRVGVQRGRLVCEPGSVYADRGDKIVWSFEPSRTYCVIVKAFAGPLNWDYFVVSKGRGWIEAVVSRDAKDGYYPYALVAVEGERLLVVDPDIIIPPPRGGRA